ncbi:hypothetical protein CEP51_016191 [Fusarium floridanum]|uniref:HAT C-terminal dimerisation domain-containing protein n=1 Tax=Fusarium floridanum TaxID=1325733 RepID=A0A428NV28_9HYPO|nr:hypothetical protein CEP51_016191 [Fusarium floridanum]
MAKSEYQALSQIALDILAIPAMAADCERVLGPRVLTVLKNWGRTRGIRFGNLLVDPIGKECREDIGQFPKLNRQWDSEDSKPTNPDLKIAIVLDGWAFSEPGSCRDYIITFAAPSSDQAHTIGLARRSRIAATLS